MFQFLKQKYNLKNSTNDFCKKITNESIQKMTINNLDNKLNNKFDIKTNIDNPLINDENKLTIHINSFLYFLSFLSFSTLSIYFYKNIQKYK